MIYTLHPHKFIYGDTNERYELLLKMVKYDGNKFDHHLINIPLTAEEYRLNGGRFVNFEKHNFRHVYTYNDKLSFLQNIINPSTKSKFEYHLDWIAMNVKSRWNFEADITKQNVTLIFSFEDEKIPALMKLLI